ncbi:DUF3703 domain-containing protein [Nonomuraea wenchangensis]|uniref:DUF3703 domain-containing protein n=1 Tax=Nonomuraea wenchangensis TaxID=568860 RepID=UPI0034174DEE
MREISGTGAKPSDRSCASSWPHLARRRGRYCEGNTGRAGVGLTQPMPMPADLAEPLQTS